MHTEGLQAHEEVSHKSTSFFHIQEEIPTITTPVLGNVGMFSIATSTVTIVLIMVFVVMLVKYVAKAKVIPTAFQNILEIIYEQLLLFVTSIVGDEKRAKRILPYVGSLALYLLIANLMFIIPGISSFYVTIGGEHVSLFRGATTDFNTTFGLALAVIVTMQVVGIREQGLFGYLGHFIQVKGVVRGFKKSIGDGFTGIISFFVGLIEIISELAKTLSLSLRLFGNMFAHETLTVILLGAFSIALPAVWMGMGLLVGLVQSVVFVALVTVYYSLVLKKDTVTIFFLCSSIM
jgi:F-type H+-transporting ATPase subunit a